MTPGTTISGNNNFWITRFLQSGVGNSVHAQAAAGGIGLLATSNTGRGVEGQGGTGVVGIGTNGHGVFARSNAGRGVEGQSLNPNEWGGIFVGQGTGSNNALAAVGRFTVFIGPKSGAVPLQGGRYVSLYAIEGTENWFEDIGGAQLANGVAVIPLDPIFNQTVNTEVEYRVFLTPNGACQLYVAEKNTGSFEVRVLAGASDCKFDYRILAKRKGFERERLEPIDFPVPSNPATSNQVVESPKSSN